ncbi:hypothetical protein NMG60_11026771 [Bertholletia excelsa]
MATLTKSFAFIVSVLLFFSNFNSLLSESVHTIPTVIAPNISSFFPSPTATNHNQPPRFEAAANPPVPGSGEFVGKTSSSSKSAKFECRVAIEALLSWLYLFHFSFPSL